MTVNIDEEVEIKFDFDYINIINKLVRTTAEYVKCPYEIMVNILFVNNDAMQIINKNNRNIDATTDVLSFPLIEYDEPCDFDCIDEQRGAFFEPDTGELLLGDIVISIDKVKSQAVEYAHTEMRELSFLVVHSMLHLFGCDHIDEEDKQMESMQREILNMLNITR